MISWWVRYLHLWIVSILFVTVVITFYLSYFHYEHVTYVWPYISDTGTFPPESCIFGQGLNIASFLVVIATYLKYLQVEDIFLRHNIQDKCKLNKITFAFALISSLGISFVANFQETNALIFHWFAAVLAFGGASSYIFLQSLLYIKISPVIGQRKTTLFRMLLSIFSVLSFLIFFISAFIAYGKFEGDDATKWKKEDGGYEIHQISTISEWICSICITVYIFLFKEEFRMLSVQPIKVFLDLSESTEVNSKDDDIDNI